MKLNEKTICNNVWSYVFFFILLEPAGFQYYRLLDRIYTLLLLFAFCIILVTLIKNGLVIELRHRKILCLLVLYYCYLLLITFINKGQITSVIGQAIRFVSFAAYLDIAMKNNPKAIYCAGLNILTLFLVLNCLIIFIFPNGLYSTIYFDNNYLLGYDNQNINFILPTLVIVLLKHNYYKRCLPQILATYLLALITVIKIWSGMSLVVVISMSAFAIFFLKKKKGSLTKKIINGRIINFQLLLLINVIAFVLIVFSDATHLLSFIIVDVLGKSLTLSGRTIIWQRALMYIVKNPIFGYGKESTEYRALKMGYRSTATAGLHAHNRFLETIYRGGVILTTIYGYMLLYVAKVLKPIRNSLMARIISFGLFIYLMGMLTEFYDYCPFFWGFMVMAENAEQYLKSIGADN